MPRNLATAALGFRVHSGWAAAVVVAGDLASPNVVARRRIEFAAPGIPGSKQPYHASERLELKEAEQFLQRCHESSVSLARKSIGDCILDADREGQKVASSGVLLGSGRTLGTLAAILASHALIHTAEGVFFRQVVVDACKHHEVPVTAVREKELLPRCENELHISQEALDRHVSSIGRIIGPPWRRDEKFAMLVAWLALAAGGRTSN
jgi:hypothetical protein